MHCHKIWQNPPNSSFWFKTGTEPQFHRFQVDSIACIRLLRTFFSPLLIHRFGLEYLSQRYFFFFFFGSFNASIFMKVKNWLCSQWVRKWTEERYSTSPINILYFLATVERAIELSIPSIFKSFVIFVLQEKKKSEVLSKLIEWESYCPPACLPLFFYSLYIHVFI